ncbi:MAG: hypothetical protein AAGF97_19850 [Planctomycetota bacterium]
MRHRRLIFVSLVVLLLLILAWMRWPQAVAPTEAPELYTQVFPVDDLLPADGNFADLLADIQTEVAPNSWEEQGGRGKLAAFPKSNALVVSQIQSVHGELSEYLWSRRHP